MAGVLGAVVNFRPFSCEFIGGVGSKKRRSRGVHIGCGPDILKHAVAEPTLKSMVTAGSIL